VEREERRQRRKDHVGIVKNGQTLRKRCKIKRSFISLTFVEVQEQWSREGLGSLFL
jgi:hypothetical protein